MKTSAQLKTHHVVVVGAGVGGLVTALLLATKGLKVTLVEKASAPGGKMRQLNGVDSGPTVFTMRWILDQVFAAAGTTLESRLNLYKLDVLARHAWQPLPGKRATTLDLFADKKQSSDAIAQFSSPAEAKRFDAFCAQASKVYRTLEAPYIRSERPTFFGITKDLGPRGLATLASLGPFASFWRLLGNSFTDPRLQQLFGRYATYCGASPWAAPATLMLIADVEMQGVWGVEGGMTMVAKVVADLAREHGVEFIYNTQVEEIVVESSRAVGVKIKNSGRTEVIRSDSVVFNGDSAAIAQGLLGVAAEAAVPKQSLVKRSLSAVTYSINAKASGFELSQHNVFFAQNYRDEFRDVFERNRLPRAGTVYVCAQDRPNQKTNHSQAERLLLLVNAPPVGDLPIGKDAFCKKEIEQCSQTHFNLLKACGLEIDLSDAQVTITTPTQFNQLFPATGGGVVRPSVARLDESVFQNGRIKPHPGPVFGGGQRTSGAGGTDGCDVGPVGGRNSDGTPRFDQKVKPGGYCWWYVDALSDCGQFGLTIIAFVGSVFSPYYRFASRENLASPENHCCLNVALYGAPGSLKNRRWTMTERGESYVSRSSTEFVIGPSAVRWDGSAMVIDINEVGVPIPFPVKGKVRVIPHGLSNRLWALDEEAKHHWGPIAPSARLEAEFSSPSIRWSGHAYLDANEGTEPINKAETASFIDWDWSRASLKDGSTAVIYDVRQPNSDRLIALKFSPTADSVENFTAPERKALPSTLWRMNRSIRSDEGVAPKVVQTLEDTPFYVRSVLESGLLGEKVISLHETLSVPKLASMSTQLMLPWRMPRTG